MTTRIPKVHVEVGKGVERKALLRPTKVVVGIDVLEEISDRANGVLIVREKSRPMEEHVLDVREGEVA